MFFGCSSLETLTLPASVAKISGNFISGTSAMTSLVIENANIETENIASDAFKGINENLVITVETDALMNYLVNTCGVPESQIESRHNDPVPELTEFTTEDGVYYKVITAPTETAKGTVQLGNGSDKVEISDSTAQIPGTVTAPATGKEYDVVKIAANAFYCNFDTSTVVIPASVKEIESKAFYYAYFLEKITFAEDSRLETIGAEAFSSCGSLKSLDLPASIANLDPKAFASSSLENVTIAEGCKAYTTIDGVVFDAAVENMIFYSAAKTDKTYVVPESVKYLPDGAFSSNKNLTEVTVGKNVVSIGEKAFSGMTKLRTVTIESAESIGKMAFWNSSSLSEVNLPANLEAIPDYLFYRCGNLSELTIPGAGKTSQDE